MDFDLLAYLNACVDGNLSDMPAPAWKDQYAMCVILASEGYPDSYPMGEMISGLDDVPGDSMAFHAGTIFHDGKILSTGGMVLGVTALGNTPKSAISRAYHSTKKIS